MRNDIIIAALREEMRRATDRLRGAFHAVADLMAYSGGRNARYENPRAQVEVAVQKLTHAASYYDAVKAELARAEGSSEADSLDVQRELAPECAA